MGLLIRVPGNFNNANLPFYTNDAVLPTGSAGGGLWLVDFSHSEGYDNGATPPVANTLIPNVAWKQAKRIIGSGDRTSLSSIIDIPSGLAANQAKVEFSSGKGLHVITSQVNMSTLKGIVIPFPAPVRNYIYNNSNRSFYVSVWGRLTRLSTASISGFMAFANKSSMTANYLFLMERDGNKPATAGLQKTVPAPANALGNFYRNLLTTSWTATKEPVMTDVSNGIKFGPRWGYDSFEVNKSNSMILYRAYVEDLTTSGRTYAEVDAIDKALYDAAFGVGGRFYNDTFTDPATLA